ncbi:unnamed protein product [Adineta ricciae]|uniref:Uncharacterized protein n=1 Tax=Adineta ricciae TaxID=249248 RepID=A0A814E5W3_ADIRI|nr:unnamed protein product [Adineta ricciae]
MGDDGFLVVLDNFVDVTNKIIGTLKAELDWIHGHHAICNAAKTVGTGAAVVGGGVFMAASLMAASFTGGASIVAAGGCGLLIGTAGAAVNLTTGIADLITTQLENKEIESICAIRDVVAAQLQIHFDELERVAHELRRLNVDEIAAYALSLRNLVFKGNSIRTSDINITQLSKCVLLARESSSTLLCGEGAFWKSMRLQPETLIKVLDLFGFNVGKTEAMPVVRTSTALLNGMFAIIDVWSLINRITGNHPTADAVSKTIDQMSEELDQTIELRKIAMEIGNGEYDK